MPTGHADDSKGVFLASVDPIRSQPVPEGIRRTAVLVTIDAEIAPHTSDWKRDSGRFALDRDVYGITPQGERGLRHQLDVIEQHGFWLFERLELLHYERHGLWPRLRRLLFGNPLGRWLGLQL